MMNDEPVRPDSIVLSRRVAAQVVIITATFLALGITLKAPSHFGANDISRWCTVWSLLERGTYAIDECPWQEKTQDKVLKPDPFQKVTDGEKPVEHFYSSKPPLLPTMIAGALYPIRQLTGKPLDSAVEVPRVAKHVKKPDPNDPTKTIAVEEFPENPILWPVHVFYLKPAVIALNIVPFLIMMFYYVRFLNRHAPNDWAWFLSLMAAALASPLFSYSETLNNHTVAGWSAAFALFGLIRMYEEESPRFSTYACVGFFGAFCACNELPAALFGLALFGMAACRNFRMALLGFLPAAILPCGAFLTTQYLAFGQFRPVYEEFGTKSYNYEDSYWNNPLEMDWFNLHPESYSTYLFHMVFGHHGIYSLTPLFLFSIWGACLLLRRPGTMRPVAILTLVLTVLMFAFYLWNPKARNYGGSTQGLRWLFWLVPFWLLFLPEGVRAGAANRTVRRLVLAALGISVMTVGYGLRMPWSHPWMLDMLEHLGLYHLTR
jgi:hypothetical protein